MTAYYVLGSHVTLVLHHLAPSLQGRYSCSHFINEKLGIVCPHSLSQSAGIGTQSCVVPKPCGCDHTTWSHALWSDPYGNTKEHIADSHATTSEKYVRDLHTRIRS